MATGRVERRLAAILAADVAGYSRLMGADEEGTHERLKAHLQQLVDPKIEEHRGRIVKNTGDGMLAEFGSVVDAVRCAVEIQRGMVDRNIDTPEDMRISFRMGVNLGDVIVEPEDIFGDGVNIAARLEALAEPGGICVSRVVHDQVAGKLDVMFEDLGERQVKNIARPVHVSRIHLGVKPAVSTPLAIDKPSIAVLPFQNMSGDPEQEYFADGMVEEIITALSRIRWLFVIARNSSFTYKGRTVDVRQIGHELGVGYVLEGSVRRAGGRVRITAQLIDATNGTHLWADRFDGELVDVFELQDKVASSVAGVIEPTLQATEIQRGAHRPTNNLTAYDLYLRAYAMAFTTPTQVPEALRLLEQAIGLDPCYGPALAYAAVCCLRLDADGLSEDLAGNSRKATEFAWRALQASDDDPSVLANAAFALGYFGEDIGSMIALVDRALRLNPSFARGWYIRAELQVWAGQADVAIHDIEVSLRLSPRGQVGARCFVVGCAHFISGRFDEAAPNLLAAIQELPRHRYSYRYLAACYAHLGRLNEARQVVERLRSMTSQIVPSVTHLRSAVHRELFVSGLRLATEPKPRPMLRPPQTNADA